ncbi:acyl-CoA desaturase [Cytophagaceae bacterium ABcell3]|nr:acyl-CoA desaturase [Cytophagaceae bacterium ABcell3]
MGIAILLIVHWYSSLFFQSVFHHRYAAHNIFSMSRGWEKAFYIGCFICQGSSYISAGAYGIMHRLHHAYTDTEQDPHSPRHTGNALLMMWQTRNNYINIYKGKTPVDKKFTKGLPSWDAFDKIAHNWVSRLIWAAIYTGLYVWFATDWWMFLFLPVHFAMGPIQGVAINWWAHVYGYVNFKMNNTSKNILPVDLVFWGEAYHNNHHKYPSRPNNAVKWYEIDFGYMIMKGMHRLGIIKLKT